jgi:hypothetical protein
LVNGHPRAPAIVRDVSGRDIVLYPRSVNH